MVVHFEHTSAALRAVVCTIWLAKFADVACPDPAVSCHLPSIYEIMHFIAITTIIFNFTIFTMLHCIATLL